MPTISRENLYELVWSLPLKKAAAQLGLSDVGLAKVCDRPQVPRPPQGHWQRLLHGRASEPTPLLPARAGLGTEVMLPDVPRDIERSPPVATPAVTIRTTLKGHSAIMKIASLLKDQKPGRDGLLVVHCDGQATFRTAPKHKDRALQVLDALTRVLVARGHVVELREAER